MLKWSIRARRTRSDEQEAAPEESQETGDGAVASRASGEPPVASRASGEPPVEQAILGILVHDLISGETIELAYRRKERQLLALFTMLPVLEARALHGRL